MITTAEFGGVASAQLIDVSNFQGQYDWNAAKAQVPGLAGGIAKLTEGTTFVDADAGHNWSALAGLGLVRGGYHFGHPGESASAQVQAFLGEASKLGLTTRDILALDLEVNDGRTAADVASWAQAFMTGLKAARPHNPVLVYTMVSFATGGECAGLGRYPLWLAFPAASAPQPPPPWARWTFWQWGTRNGVDADAFNGTVAELHAWVDSFQPDPAPPAGTGTGTGPFRHYTAKGDTLADLAAARNTTAWHLVEMAAANYTAGDEARLAKAELPSGLAWYTSNP